MTIEIAKNGVINTNIRIFNCRKLIFEKIKKRVQKTSE